MSLEKLKNQTFSSITHEDWIAKAESSLKGKTMEVLKSNTYENITLKPLYLSQDEESAPNYPGGSDFRRGIDPLGYVTNNWRVAQKIAANTPAELKEKLINALEKGQTALSFDVTEGLLADQDTLQILLGSLPEKHPFALNAKNLQIPILKELIRLTEELSQSDKVTGYIASDPISMFVEEGVISDGFLASWTEEISLVHKKIPNMRTVLVDTSIYHQGGANAVQELGIAAAAGVFYLQQLSENGLSLEDILSKMVFNFSIGSHFFMELAKLRAARILWNKITGAYGAKGTVRGMIIAAETSSYTKTVHDSHVNILRAGNEAFAAVIGGVQYLHVTPFDQFTGHSQLGERIARNTQNILQAEAHLQKVVDPAGGSWYVESLTSELAEKAWDFFKKIEANGGILEVLKTGSLQNEIKAVNENRKQDIFTRKQSIIGSNVYANLDEVVTAPKVGTTDQYFNSEGAIIEITKIEKTRLSEPYENLRNMSKKLEEKLGSKPQVGMICLGELKQYKPRLDFMRGFLSAGGIKAVESGPSLSYETAEQFISNAETKHFCLCGSNEQYETIGHEILTSLHSAFPDITFYLAGLPEKDLQTQWKYEGIAQFIHIKSNCYEILSTILKEMEVAVNEVTKA
jgi:methylmalonyl-CoA mutase